MKPFVIPPERPRTKSFVLLPPKRPPKTPDSVRQAKSKDALREAGGRRVSINLPAGSLSDIEKITDKPGINTITEAVIAALDHFARCKPARKSGGVPGSRPFG